MIHLNNTQLSPVNLSTDSPTHTPAPHFPKSLVYSLWICNQHCNSLVFVTFPLTHARKFWIYKCSTSRHNVWICVTATVKTGSTYYIYNFMPVLIGNVYNSNNLGSFHVISIHVSINIYFNECSIPLNTSFHLSFKKWRMGMREANLSSLRDRLAYPWASPSSPPQIGWFFMSGLRTPEPH